MFHVHGDKIFTLKAGGYQFIAGQPFDRWHCLECQTITLVHRNEDWEWGVEYEVDNNSENNIFTVAHSKAQAEKWVAESPTDTGLRRRHPAGPWEEV